ncbi:MAG: hypothetical protein DWB45_02875 [Xanthomonadales bacterium]|nr:hypothetical protein [Xanthomonadales bacterium]MDL1868993.1 hypothetical protein [Gammaproteobacteria bacterium PRO6]
MTIQLPSPASCAVALALLVGGHVHAGVDPIPAASAPRGLGEIDALDENAMRTAPAKTHVLRCWQKGRLIIERRIDRIPGEADGAVRLAIGEGGAMRLYDLGNSTCLID